MRMVVATFRLCWASWRTLYTNVEIYSNFKAYIFGTFLSVTIIYCVRNRIKNFKIDYRASFSLQLLTTPEQSIDCYLNWLNETLNHKSKTVHFMHGYVIERFPSERVSIVIMTNNLFIWIYNCLKPPPHPIPPKKTTHTQNNNKNQNPSFETNIKSYLLVDVSLALQHKIQ